MSIWITLRSVSRTVKVSTFRKNVSLYSLNMAFSTVKRTADDIKQIEEELFVIKRKMTLFFNRGNFTSALDFAQRQETATEKYFGKKNPLYASCVSNVALMHKQLGNHETAMHKYVDALHIYRSVTGKTTKQYASTLSNLGILYKLMAEASKGLDREQLWERSEEAHEEAWKVLLEINGPTHKDTLHSVMAYCSILRTTNKLERCEKLLNRALSDGLFAHGELDTIVANVYNSLGLAQKAAGKFGEAKESYEKAIAIQSEVLGDEHRDCVTSRHNLAEMFMAAGDQQSANDVQEHILEILNIDVEDVVDTKALDRDRAQAAGSGDNTNNNSSSNDATTMKTGSDSDDVASWEEQDDDEKNKTEQIDKEALAADISDAVDSMLSTSEQQEVKEEVSSSDTTSRKRRSGGVGLSFKNIPGGTNKSDKDGFVNVGHGLSAQVQQNASNNKHRDVGTGNSPDDPTDEELFGFSSETETAEDRALKERHRAVLYTSRKKLIQDRLQNLHDQGVKATQQKYEKET